LNKLKQWTSFKLHSTITVDQKRLDRYKNLNTWYIILFPDIVWIVRFHKNKSKNVRSDPGWGSICTTKTQRGRDCCITVYYYYSIILSIITQLNVKFELLRTTDVPKTWQIAHIYRGTRWRTSRRNRILFSNKIWPVIIVNMHEIRFIMKPKLQRQLIFEEKFPNFWYFYPTNN